MKNKKTKKEVKRDYLSIDFSGYELDELIAGFLKEKLGNVELTHIELVTRKIKNKHILNDEENSFSVFVEYDRES